MYQQTEFELKVTLTDNTEWTIEAAILDAVGGGA